MADTAMRRQINMAAADSELRKAAEEFAHVASMTKVKFDNDEHKAVFAEAYENLRAALEGK